jgi:hypothetical protein
VPAPGFGVHAKSAMEGLDACDSRVLVHRRSVGAGVGRR